MVTQSETPTSELEALQELEKLGIQEVDGHPLADLKAWAENRQKALEALCQAQEAFAQGLGGGKEEDMRSAFAQAQAALGGLQQIAYPETPLFAARRAALQADMARAKALLRALDTWWWQRFAQAIADVYANLKAPDRAREHLSVAEGFLRSWPDMRDIAESNKPEAYKLFEEVRSAIDDLAVRQFRALLDEAKAWIDLAPNEESETALQCLVHAEASYAAAARLSAEMRGPRQNLFKKDLEDLKGELGQKKGDAIKSFSEAVAKRREEEITNGFAEWLQAAQEANQSGSNWTWLLLAQEAQGLRQRLDDLIALLEPNPHLLPKLSNDLRDVIRRRKANLRRSAELLSEVQWASPQPQQTTDTPAHGYGDAQGQDPTLYYRWRRIKEAHALDPDNRDSADLLKSLEQKWKALERDLNARFEAIGQKLGEIERQTDAIQGASMTQSVYGGVNDLAALQKQFETINGAMDKVNRELEALGGDLGKQLELPPEWQPKLLELRSKYERYRQRMTELQKGIQDIQALIEAWRQAPHDLRDLIARTQKACEAKLPPPIKQAGLDALLNAVRSALPEIRDRRPEKIRQFELTWLLWQLKAGLGTLQPAQERSDE